MHDTAHVVCSSCGIRVQLNERPHVGRCVGHEGDDHDWTEPLPLDRFTALVSLSDHAEIEQVRDKCGERTVVDVTAEDHLAGRSILEAARMEGFAVTSFGENVLRFSDAVEE